MGRVTNDIRTAFRTAAIATAVLAVVLVAAAPAAKHEHEAGSATSGESKDKDAKTTGHEEETPNPLRHVMDSYEIELFESLGPKHIPLPHWTFGHYKLSDEPLTALRKQEVPEGVVAKLTPLKDQEFRTRQGFEKEIGKLLDESEQKKYGSLIVDEAKGSGHEFTIGLSKFMLLEVIAALLVAAFYIPLGQRVQSGEVVSGWRHHAREVVLTFIRDEIAKPAIGHDADKYVPFLWTMFLFILFNNLLGLIPFCGSATGNIYVTAGLALCVFGAIHGSAIQKLGFGHYLSSMWPHFEIPYGMGIILKPMIFLLEWLGVLVRNLVLAVRLFANMFAGHVVLATILIFIYVVGHEPFALRGSITVASVLGQVALSLLELFVAFLQAYIFTFLTSLFMGMAMHPAH